MTYFFHSLKLKKSKDNSKKRDNPTHTKTLNKMALYKSTHYINKFIFNNLQNNNF